MSSFHTVVDNSFDSLESLQGSQNTIVFDISQIRVLYHPSWES